MKKLPFRYLRLALPMGTTFFMTFLVSGVATFRAMGHVDGMFAKWMTSWAIAWVIAFPTMYFMMPVVRRWLSCIIEEK